LVAPDQRVEYRKREQKSSGALHKYPVPGSAESACEWFKLEPGQPASAHELAGPWSRGIDSKKTEIELAWRLVPNKPRDVLLRDGDETIVAGQSRHGGQLLTVVNGSFLLNLPLANHEHRKLAGKLIAAAAAPGRVVFLESSEGGPPIDPPATDGSLWQVFGAWPLSTILLHFGVLGVIFCFARWPIFGRPKSPPADSIADFGKHVEAVGALLRRTRDRDYALAQLPPAEDTESLAPLRHQPIVADARHPR